MIIRHCGIKICDSLDVKKDRVRQMAIRHRLDQSLFDGLLPENIIKMHTNNYTLAKSFQK